MKHPTFDGDGYPTEETEKAIAEWDIRDLSGVSGLVAFLREAWSDYGVIRRDGTRLELITGGWSGNEQLISALKRSLFWFACWKASYRGGLHVFGLPEDFPGEPT